jgi:hypothetical protein
MTEQAVPAPALGNRVWSRLISARDWLASVRPLYVLGTLIAIQWIAVIALALTVRHNEWLYYQGGDQLWLWTSATQLIHGHIPYALVSYGWPALVAPFAAIFGNDLLSALPVIEVLQVLLLLPVPLLCLYGIGRRLGGRIFGYWTAALWIAVPFLGIWYTLSGYHQKYTELNLPEAFGLSAMSDFPSLVALCVAAYLTLRTLEDTRRRYSIGLGLAVGFALAIKPSNALFAIAVAIVMVIWGRRTILPAAAAVLPTLVALAIWKDRGLGRLPVLHGGAGTKPHTMGVLAISNPLRDYFNFNWHQLHLNLLQIQEHFWSLRVIEWLVIAGAIGILRRSRPIGVLVVVWFAAYVIVKGTFPHASIQTGDLLRLMIPAAPAFVLLLASIPFLWPKVRTARPVETTPLLSERWAKRATIAAIVVFAVWPLALVAYGARGPLRDAKRALVIDALIPVDQSLAPTLARQPDGTVKVSWHGWNPAGAKVFYRVYRYPQGESINCNGVNRGGAVQCVLDVKPLTATRSTSFSDAPPNGKWAYRVGVAANWLNSTAYGDVYAVSPPVKLPSG